MRLSMLMDERQFARREVALGKEQTRTELGFLLEGRLQGIDFTVDGRGVGLYFVEPGDYFGELSIIDGLPPAEHVIAAAKSTAVFLDAAQARKLIVENPDLAQAVMARMAARVRAAAAQRTLLALPNPFQRLSLQLLLLARSTGPQTASLDPAPTHQELAIMINASRETVTRAFQVLMLQEVIRREGGQLLLLRRDYLTDIGAGKIEPPKT
jgi:CRP-like cAMP-binding protein